MIYFIKTNFFSALLLLGSGVLFIYSVYNGFHEPDKIIDTSKKIVDNTLKLDSLRTKIEEDYRNKIDSISYIYNNEISKLKKQDKKLDEKIKSLNVDIGDLPDFK